MRIISWIVVLTILVSCKTTQKDNAENLSEPNVKEQISDLNSETNSFNEELPSSLKEYIENNLKQYYIPSTDEYVKEWQDFTEKKQLPFFAYSDFNNDGSIDYAVVLKYKDSSKVSLFIFNTNEKEYSQYRLAYNNVKEIGIETIVSVEKKGTWEAIDTTITVNSDGVMVQLITESLSYAYYWDGQQYKEFLFD